jgi:hypothetical protein
MSHEPWRIVMSPFSTDKMTFASPVSSRFFFCVVLIMYVSLVLSVMLSVSKVRNYFFNYIPTFFGLVNKIDPLVEPSVMDLSPLFRGSVSE